MKAKTQVFAYVFNIGDKVLVNTLNHRDVEGAVFDVYYQLANNVVIYSVKIGFEYIDVFADSLSKLD